VDIARVMHTEAMRQTAPGVPEQTVAGELWGAVRSRGGWLSFQPTFSVHGEVLHNTITNRPMQEGELALCDAGAETGSHYASDITRVTPVSGTFSERQRDIYQVVLNAQERAIEAIAPGVPYKQIHLQAARDMTASMKDLGFMRGDVDEAVAAGAHAIFFPHGLGHMMGLDVHDMEGLGEDYVGYDADTERSDQFGLNYLRLARPLEPGFVLTVEPGVYFIPALIDHWKAEGRHEAFINYDRFEQFKDFGGIRLEDDVLVTEAGHRILGASIPKAVDEVEALAGEAHARPHVRG
jgi:Xaa-Pro aminopeptidase